MLSQSPSILNFAAAGVYALVALACCGAAMIARSSHQSRFLRRGWLILCLFFLALIAWRLSGAEDWSRDILRGMIKQNDFYAERGILQLPAAIILLGAAIVAAILASKKSIMANRKGRRSFALLIAIGATVALACLIALRIVSYHQIDWLLYGPLKLNWVADLGLSFAVGGAAIYCTAISRSHARGA